MKYETNNWIYTMHCAQSSQTGKTIYSTSMQAANFLASFDMLPK